MSLYTATAPGGANTQIQFNDNGLMAGDPDLTWDDTGKELAVGGNINLDDGGTYQTTLQLVTPTANRTISFPDATGTVALVAGSSGQVTYNSSGAQAGDANLTWSTTTGLALGKPLSVSVAGAASAPPGTFTGTWFTGGTATTTKPQVLIEPSGTTSTAWSTSGTGLGINAASGFTGRLLDAQVNGTSRMVVTGAGNVGLGTINPSVNISVVTPSQNALAQFTDGTINTYYGASNALGAGVVTVASNHPLRFDTNNLQRMTIAAAGNVGINETAPDYKLDVNGTFGFAPGASVTPVDNGDVVFELTDNTTLTIKAKGSDGVVRSGTITLA